MAEATKLQAGKPQAQADEPQEQIDDYDDYDERRFGHFKWLKRETRGE
jgi:hypothetical protein